MDKDERGYLLLANTWNAAQNKESISGKECLKRECKGEEEKRREEERREQKIIRIEEKRI